MLEKKQDNCFIRKIKQWYNKFHQQQKKYTSFDMTDKFNEYKMFLCPEELVGVPGIGTIEGMACGTAYIGLRHSMYDSWGFVPGKNYIDYDGSLESLKKKVHYYQEHPQELEKIAREGERHVRENFAPNIVAARFLDELKKLSQEDNRGEKHI